MPPTPHLFLKPGEWSVTARRALASWWYMIHLAAVAMVMALSPSTYNRANRGVVAQHIYTGTWQVLPWFTALNALISLVVIRIVIVTALSYGLSQFALEMMVRVLVLELIPLTAALFVALRAGLVFHAENAAAPTSQPAVCAARQVDAAQLRRDLVPQVISSAFAVLSLALVSSVIVLVLAYLNVYGLSPWGLAYYTRTVGRVFDPVVTIGFAFKTILFGLAVAVIPMAAMLEARHANAKRASAVQPGAIRLFLVLFLIEAGSLAVKYI